MMKKKKRFLSLALALVLCLGLVPMSAQAAESDSERGVIHYTEVIAPQYEDAHSFSSGLAAVKKDGKWGYIDTDNQVVIPFQYDQAYDFKEGLAIVGEVTSSEEYVTSEPDANGEPYDVLVTRYSVKYGFIDKTGAYTPFLFVPYWATQLAAESFSVTIDTEDLNFEGDGRIFHSGYVWLCAEPGSAAPYVLFDTTGREVQDADGYYLTTDNPLPVNEGLALDGIFFGGGYKFVDVKTGQVVLNLNSIPDVDGIKPACSFNQGLLPVWVYPLDKDTWEWGNGQLGFLDRQGNWVIQPVLGDGYFYYALFTEQRLFGATGLAMVEGTNGKYGAIDKQGNTIIPFQYDELWSDNEGRATFCLDGKYGYLDAAGDHSVVIPAQFEKASGYGNGLAAVYDGTKAYLIDWNGNPVPGTEDLDPDAYFREDENGNKTTYAPDEYLTIRKDDKYGFGHIEYLPALPDESEMENWAYEEVTAAIEADLIPASMQNLYGTDITRGEFCSLAVHAVETVFGQDIADVVKTQTGKELSAFQQEYPFLDASGEDVIACYALGILKGRGSGVADPYAPIIRQEAAAYLTRTAKVMGMDVDVQDALTFADAESVSEWFTQAVAFVYDCGVMNGTGNNQFSPLDSYTREQSYATFYRLYNAAK